MFANFFITFYRKSGKRSGGDRQIEENGSIDELTSSMNSERSFRVYRVHFPRQLFELNAVVADQIVARTYEHTSKKVASEWKFRSNVISVATSWRRWNIDDRVVKQISTRFSSVKIIVSRILAKRYNHIGPKEIGRVRGRVAFDIIHVESRGVVTWFPSNGTRKDTKKRSCFPTSSITKQEGRMSYRIKRITRRNRVRNTAMFVRERERSTRVLETTRTLCKLSTDANNIRL